MGGDRLVDDANVADIDEWLAPHRAPRAIDFSSQLSRPLVEGRHSRGQVLNPSDLFLQERIHQLLLPASTANRMPAWIRQALTHAR
jgi:hypothetical protein